MEQHLTIWDLVLTPLFLVVLILLAKRIRDKNYPEGHPLRKYYLPGLLVKLGGAIFIGLVYQYYYGGGGDTFRYYECGKIVNSSLSDSLMMWIKLLAGASPDTDPYLYQYTSAIEFYTDASSYMVVRLCAVFGLLTFNTYIPIALLFAFAAYTGIWAMYRTFCKAFPNRYKELAIAFLFVPSVFVWGSAIFKDTICMFGLGWLTYTCFQVFVDKNFSIKNIVLLVLSFTLVGVVKVYILLAFLPSLMLWLLLTYSHHIRSAALRIMAGLAVLGVVTLGFLYFANTFSQSLERYSLSNLSSTVETTRNWITYSSGDEGSAYDLGEFDPSLGGIIKIFPAGVTVTLFRPFLWEVKKPIQLLSALESLVFVLLTLAIFIKNGVLFTFRRIFSDPNLIFLFTFSLIFAFAVGVSTGNFGSLSRYKIPCLPFFAALLAILYFTRQQESTKKQFRKSAPDPVSINTPSYLH